MSNGFGIVVHCVCSVTVASQYINICCTGLVVSSVISFFC